MQLFLLALLSFLTFSIPLGDEIKECYDFITAKG